MRLFSLLLLVVTAGCDADKDIPADTAETGMSDEVDADGDGYVAADDCDETNADIHPDAEELCDGVDQNCDGVLDDGVGTAWYADADADGYGDAASETLACTAPENTVADATDCDDTSASVSPGAAESCNEVDDDCDGTVDEDVTTTFYADADQDGYGDAATAADACAAAEGWVADGTDCDDADAAYNPGVPEECTDPNDYNCDGSVGYADADGDGFAACADCDDTDSAVNADASEVCDTVDNDCDGATDEDDAADAGTWYRDADADGYGDPSATFASCAVPTGYVADATDCDGRDAAVYPGAVERCDGVDHDCDGLTDEDDAEDASTWYSDTDDDGYGDVSATARSCVMPSGYVADYADCDDADAMYNPSALEECTDPNDYNCDGAVGYADADGDGYAACADCDDTNGAVNDDAFEVCDGVDNDCDGSADEDDAADAETWYADADGDTYGDPSVTTLSCALPSGYVADATDCDDASAGVNPTAVERCDGADDDCDGVTDEDDAADAITWYADADGDTYGDPAATATACDEPSGYTTDANDCDDDDGRVFPGAAETCDGADDDCDGVIDEADAVDAETWYADDDGDAYGNARDSVESCTAPSGYLADATDCDDGDGSTHPGAIETCDGTDEDCDGLIDDDVECFTDFDGTYSGRWETLTASGEYTYSLMTYQPSDIHHIYNMYDTTGQKYDPDLGSWTTLAATSPYSQPWCSMAPSGGDLWMIRNLRVYQYAPTTDTWTTVATTLATDDYAMTESDEYGIIYGHDSRGNMVTYDTTTGAVAYHSTGLGSEYETRMGYDPEERAIFFGAYNARALYRWDIGTGAVTTMTPHPEAQLNDIFCSDRSGHIYAAGNTSGSTMYQYDIASNTWAAITSLPTDHGNNGSCTVSADGYLYVGTGSNATFYRMELY
ncbi:MAG: putative metal-binding motif-containing protein [Pseudomonadota bacterium]|nr:putative metal-binding motif-containing protein [Pseudomonadota bacterium]